MWTEVALFEFADELARAAWLRGVAAEARGDGAGACVEFRTVCDLEPGNARARRRLGMACLTAGRLDEALNAFTALCEEDRESGDAWSLAAFTLAAMGEVEDSMRAYRLSVGREGADAGQYLNLGSLCISRGLYAEAEEVLFEAVRLWPEYPGAHFKMGLAREGAGNEVGALASFRRAAQLNPRWGEAHYRHGRMCEAIGCLGEAFEAYDRAISSSPSAVEYRERMAGVCDGLGESRLAEVHRSVVRLLCPGAGEELRAA